MSAQQNYPPHDPRDETNRAWDGPINEPVLYCSYSLVDSENRPCVCIYDPDRPEEWLVVDEPVASNRYRVR